MKKTLITCLLVALAIGMMISMAVPAAADGIVPTITRLPPLTYQGNYNNDSNSTGGWNPVGSSYDWGFTSGVVRWGGKGHYYQAIFGIQCEWFQAEDYALERGGHLVTINSFAEQTFCNTMRQVAEAQEGATSETWWIGLERLDEYNTNWFWDTGEPLEPTSFSYWYGTEGVDTLGHYACMETWDNDLGEWGSHGDGNQYYADGFIIEYPDPPPTADAGQDQTVPEGTMVILNGGNSSDPDGDALTFSWEISSAPNGNTVTLNNPDSATPSFTPDVPGTYVLTLVVTDSYGASSEPDQVSITVGKSTPESPTVISYNPWVQYEGMFAACIGDGQIGAVNWQPGNTTQHDLVVTGNVGGSTIDPGAGTIYKLSIPSGTRITGSGQLFIGPFPTNPVTFGGGDKTFSQPVTLSKLVGETWKNNGSPNDPEPYQWTYSGGKGVVVSTFTSIKNGKAQ